jgi:type II secretory pathway component PulF
MAAFTYVAVDRTGRKVSGSVPADSRAAAMDAVAGLGLSPVSLEESGSNGSSVNGHARRPLFGGHKIPKKSVESFTRELANLLAGGLSLSRALALLKREASHPAAKEAWTKIHDDVVGGEALADTLAKFPDTFPRVYVAMVRAGETGGFLHVVLQQISDFRQREQDLTGKVKAAMIYPMALATVASAVVIFLLTFFIPKFTTIFAQFGSKLPWMTRVVVAVSGTLIKYGPFVLIALIVGIVAFRQWARSHQGRRTLEALVLRVPALGIVIARFALVRFCRMLGTLIGAGVPLVVCLRTSKEALGNQTLADTVGFAIEQVQRGTALSKALSTNSLLFPASVIEMISVAEETGRLDQELIRLAAAYELDLDRNLRILVSLAEPLLLIVMAAMIGTVVVAMLLPVFTLQDMIN